MRFYIFFLLGCFASIAAYRYLNRYDEMCIGLIERDENGTRKDIGVSGLLWVVVTLACFSCAWYSAGEPLS